MAEEKETKKTSRTKSTTTKKKTTTKKTTTKKPTTKRVVKKEVKEEVIPYQDELTTVEEQPIPYQDELSTIQEVPQEVVQPVVEEKVQEDTKPSIWIFILIGILIMAMGVVIGYCLFSRVRTVKNGNFIFITENHNDAIIDSNYVRVSSFYELSELFPNYSFRDVDFSTYDYVVLRIPYDSCSESNVEPVGYSIKNNLLEVKVEYEASCGVCAPNDLYYLLEIDKNAFFTDFEFDYVALNDPHCNPYVAYKPIIYFYPEKETKLQVTLGYPDKLTTTYPKYQNGWNVVAYPDGTLKDSKNREYYSLFWEGEEHYAIMKEDGFVVAGSDTLSFLEEKLSLLGLNEREANEFIIFWLPKLENNAYNYIRFETREEIEEYMPLTVNPNPDTTIRVQMDYKPLTNKISVKEQTILTPERVGFTVVEWGGSIIQ